MKPLKFYFAISTLQSNKFGLSQCVCVQIKCGQEGHCLQSNKFGSEKRFPSQKTWTTCPIKSLFVLAFQNLFLHLTVSFLWRLFLPFSNILFLSFSNTPTRSNISRRMWRAGSRWCIALMPIIQRKLRTQNGCSKYASTALQMIVVVVSSTKERV